MYSKKVAAGEEFPLVTVKNLANEYLQLGVPAGDNDWQIVVVYRGKHCPLCTKFLNQLAKVKDELSELGIDIVAVSADSKLQLESHLPDLDVNFTVCYGLTVEQMQDLGLYISHPRSEQETDHLFAEPGLFVVDGDFKVVITDIANAPFSRPNIETLLAGLKFLRKPDNNYPIRGTYHYN